MAALAALAGSAGVASVGLFYYVLLAALLRDRGKIDDSFSSVSVDDSAASSTDELDLTWTMEKIGSEWRLKDDKSDGN
jgi:hypothetical protein